MNQANDAAAVLVDQPKVSVLMLAFNHERFIEQALKSAVDQQTSFPYEIVVGEDCSTDSTRQILEELAAQHADRVRVLLRESNVGIRDNFRETLQSCRGQYVAVLEGDDFWTDPSKLQRQVNALDAHPEWSICFHRVQVILTDGASGGFEPAEEDFPHVTGLPDLLRRNYISTPSVMFRNRLFIEWPTEFDDLVQQDWPLHVMNAQHGQVGYLPESLAAYRRHSTGIWSSQSSSRRIKWWFDAYDAMEDYLGAEHSADIREGRYLLAAQIGEQLDQVLGSRDLRWGNRLLSPIRILRKLFRSDPTT